VTQRSLLVRNFNRARLRDGSALSRGRSAEPEEPDGGRVLDSNIKRVAEPEREEPDDDGRYYAPHEFDGRPDVYATGADPLLQALRREHPERDPCPTH
jgi:hypothetical protein